MDLFLVSRRQPQRLQAADSRDKSCRRLTDATSLTKATDVEFNLPQFSTSYTLPSRDKLSARLTVMQKGASATNGAGVQLLHYTKVITGHELHK